MAEVRCVILRGTHPSPQKRWGQETEAVVLQPRKWDSASAIQEFLRWALWLAWAEGQIVLPDMHHLPDTEGWGIPQVQ